ncbi:MAG: sodium-dependent transporter, partial [Gammaproteobacteria bacterium]|nr:sodium-dependent transporter [Gammaproteobacteria bacterium]
LSILSYNVIADWQVGSRDLNGILDYVSNQIMLPVGGLLIAVFTAWQIHKPTLREELHAMPAWIFETWHLLIRFLLPIAITVILVTGLAW